MKSLIFFKRPGQPRRIFAGIMLFLLAAGWVAFFQVKLTTDVAALLPDRGNEAVYDFRRLAEAPLARRIVLRLRARDLKAASRLIKTADKLAARLKPPLFTQVITGPGQAGGESLLAFALDEWPNLMGADDLEQISGRLVLSRVSAALQAGFYKLLQPTGFFQKKLILLDPLEFRNLILPRLVSLNPVGRARVRDGHFFSSDGLETMLLLETPVAITNFSGAQVLLGELEQVLAVVVPEGIEPVILSGHLYTVANAKAIQHDMKVVITASLISLLLIFLVFMRRRRALLIFLLPVAILGPALALTALVDGSVSAITIGFGAVLLGVTIDYGLHVYFSLTDLNKSPEDIIADLSPPLLGAGLTTIGAFAVQLFSVLPGQRQLALFAIFGVVLALGVALLFLPQFLRGAAKSDNRDTLNLKPAGVREGDCLAKKRPLGRSCHQYRFNRAIVAIWLVCLMVMFCFAFKIDCAGDLRQINLVPERLRQAENSLKSVWGEVRGRALVFAEGATFAEALQVNDKLYAALRKRFSSAEILSLAPVLPSRLSQTENRKAWKLFWSRERLNELQKNLFAAGQRYGFAPAAFVPFLEKLKKLPPELSESYWRRAGFSPLFDALIEKTSHKVTILTMIPDIIQSSLLSADGKPIPGVRLVSPRCFSEEVSRAVSRDLKQFIIWALVVVSLVLVLLLRNIYHSFLALLPVVAGLLSMFGIMGLLGISFNLFNLVAAILIIGVGVDYGIFMVYRLFRGHNAAIEKAVLVSGLTTLAGFGVLVLARHPALNSIGLTVLLGVGGALPTVLWVLPALAGLRKRV